MAIRSLQVLFAFTLITALLFNACGEKESAPDPYETFADQAAAVWHFQGAYLVAKGDSVLARGAVGLADIHTNRMNTPQTKFLIGSMTKTFTAIAVMQLVEQDKIDLQASYDTYLSDVLPDIADRVTIHELLSHRTGIVDVGRSPEFSKDLAQPIAPRDLIALVKDQPLAFQPGSNYQYSSTNYLILGLIIEKVSGEAWEDYIQAHICTPAGMSNTGVVNDYLSRDDFAYGHAPDQLAGLTIVPQVHLSRGYAAGALSSTVDDLFKLNQALYRGILIKPETLDLMITAHSPAYGYGWIVENFGGHRLTAHGGGAPGYTAIFQRWVDDSVCVVVLSNFVRTPVHALGNGLAAIALGEHYDLPNSPTPIMMTPDDLSDYLGTYQTASGKTRTASIDQNGRLVVQGQAGVTMILVPEAPDTFFFAHDATTKLIFLRDDDGAVAGQEVKQAFDSDTMPKIR